MVNFHCNMLVHQRVHNINPDPHPKWPLMEPRKIGGTYQTKTVYVFGLCKGISPQNMAKHMVHLVAPFNRILKFPLTKSGHFFSPNRFCAIEKSWCPPPQFQTGPSALRLASKSFFRFTSSLASVGCTI